MNDELMGDHVEEVDEIEEVDEVDDVDGLEAMDDIDDDDDDDDSGEVIRKSRSKEFLEDSGSELKDSLRMKIQSDVEAFLANGGCIREIEPNIVANPPKKPQSNYGGQPI